MPSGRPEGPRRSQPRATPWDTATAALPLAALKGRKIPAQGTALGTGNALGTGPEVLPRPPSPLSRFPEGANASPNRWGNPGRSRRGPERAAGNSLGSGP